MSEFIPNSFQTPNMYIDRYMSYLTDAEFRVLIYTVRRIFGFQKRQDSISLSQYTNGISNAYGEHLDGGCGVNSRETVRKALESLIGFNLIIRVARNNPLLNAGDTYSLQLDSSQVDMLALERREENRKSKARERTLKARVKVRRTGENRDGGQSDRPPPVSGTNHPRSVGLTTPGQWDRPPPVSRTDSQSNSLNPDLNTGENQREGAPAGVPEFDAFSVKDALRVPEIWTYKQVTNRIPGEPQWSVIYSAVREIATRRGVPVKTLGEYLTPFWDEWAGVRGYRPASLVWLTEWAMQGEIPTGKPNGNGHKPGEPGRVREPAGFAGIREYLRREQEKQSNGEPDTDNGWNTDDIGGMFPGF